MTEESMHWLGAAFWLKDHGAEWVIEAAPEMVVPMATALATALAASP